jgi:hypothetical protein
MLVSALVGPTGFVVATLLGTNLPLAKPEMPPSISASSAPG